MIAFLFTTIFVTFNERWGRSQEKNSARDTNSIQCFSVIFRVPLTFQTLMKLTVHNDEMSQTVLQQ